MTKSKDGIASKVPSVHSLLMAVGEGQSTKEMVYKKYLGYRPGDRQEEAITFPVDLPMIEEYLLNLTDRLFIKQSVVSWGNSGRASQFVYSLNTKGRNLLNRKKK